MTRVLTLLTLCGVGLHGATALAADGTSAHRTTAARKAEFYEMEARQYAAAGKPATLFLAHYYGSLGHSYRHLAAPVHKAS